MMTIRACLSLLIHRGWGETATRKWIVAIAFTTDVFLIGAMRTAHTGIAIGLLIAGCSVAKTQSKH